MSRRRRTLGALGLFSAAVAIAIAGALALRPHRPPAAPPSAQRPRSGTADCPSCHPAQQARWTGSQHAAACRGFDRARDAAALHLRPAPVAVIGVAPLRQYLLPAPGGRLHVLDPALDVQTGAWFSIFGADRPGAADWGAQRGMNWNAQCAACHMTGLRKGYDPGTDTYQTTWAAMGVTCLQCHGPSDAGQKMSTCASCHARHEELTGAFRPGDDYHDHYRLLLPDQPGLFYPDGQAREEVFEFASLLLSRMGHRGVTCLDCHEPHAAALRAKAEDDALCLGCHGPPGQRGALVIDPARHSHHPAASAGARCVECHMPRRVYMQRDARRDHGFTSPDPHLSRELGVPNACTSCHRDRSNDWAAVHTDAWFGAGADRDRPARRRARAVARAQGPRPERAAGAALLAAARAEEISAWRAALVGMLAPHGDDAEVRAFLRASLDYESPLVRAAAVRALSLSNAAALAQARREDPVRVVRLAALWAARPDISAAGRGEIQAWLDHNADQPAGALRQSELALGQGRPRDAVAWAHKAARWDPSGPSYYALGRVLAATGQVDEARAALDAAIAREGDNVTYLYALALLLGERGQHAAAAAALERVVALDPSSGRAFYNLGLARASLGQLEASARALGSAAALMPGSIDPPWALATVRARMGQEPAAREAARRVLALRPDHEGARALLLQGKAAITGDPAAARPPPSGRR